MYKYKGGKYTLKQIFKDAEEEEKNGIKIEYICKINVINAEQ